MKIIFKLNILFINLLFNKLLDILSKFYSIDSFSIITIKKQFKNIIKNKLNKIEYNIKIFLFMFLLIIA